jgi:hypothetical protein
MAYEDHLKFASSAPLTHKQFIRVLDCDLDNIKKRRCRIGKITLKRP